jgi:hypothetical protein
MNQRVAIFGLDFTIMRIIVSFGLIRMFLESRQYALKLNVIDKTLVAWVAVSVLSYTLMWQTVGAFVNRLGFAFNALGVYFAFRFFIRDFKEVDFYINVFAVIACVVAFFMVFEHATHRNVFAVFGGVPEFTSIRDGRLRAQGAFAHPITAGMFGATMMPLYVSLWWRSRSARRLAALGLFAATIITVASASSGPVLTYVAGIIGFCFWSARDHMRAIRWGMAFALLFLHIAMKAPVWALIQRVGVMESSSGYHRYKLVDNFINNIGDWWLIGKKFTYDWGWQMFDAVNQYVNEGIHGGILKFSLFIAIIALCFRGVGKLRHLHDGRPLKLRFWAFGVALFAHAVGFFGISYFDQTLVAWYFLLAAISILSSLPAGAIREGVTG